MRVTMLLAVATLVAVGVFLGTGGMENFNSSGVSNNPTYYEDYDWDELPLKVQQAAHVLGFNKGIWDHDDLSEQFDEEWWELTNEEREAAKVLGYDEKTWCVEYEEYEDEMEDRREFYPEWDWEELPPDAQAAATVFGFTQYSWDNELPVMAMDKEWDDLTIQEKQAAKTLGYDEDLWCDDYWDYVADSEDNWIYEDWEDLPAKVKQAARTFGFDEQKWNNDADVPDFDMDWAELSEGKKQAAQTLGYTEAIWCGNFEEFEEKEQAVWWMDEDFEDMPKEVQNAVLTFGFTQETWDEGARVPDFNQDWPDLTDKQRDAAKVLGYTEEIWCEDFDEEEEYLQEEYEAWDWEELPANVQEAATVLGFTPAGWDDDQNIPAFDKDWEELTTEEQQAAITIGWDRDDWCEEYEEWGDRRRLRKGKIR